MNKREFFSAARFGTFARSRDRQVFKPAAFIARDKNDQDFDPQLSQLLSGIVRVERIGEIERVIISALDLD